MIARPFRWAPSGKPLVVPPPWAPTPAQPPAPKEQP